ncbi:MAG TPA: TonB-dependent receptor [Rhodocyclaceae bacterium]|nr:TonB-dependent receptor [Rhodocyclaceae bacterium]
MVVLNLPFCLQRTKQVLGPLSVMLALMPLPLCAAPMQVAALADLSFEELANIEVTSVSKRAERLSDAPAAIFVISADDIRRSGAISLPEALRLAPNLDIARVNGSTYAISARGFNNAIGNKLLVLIDGRTVYTPTFSGVNWDSQFVMLEDVERIEVISGPGGALWGANAVNGVINVITRKAKDTQGGLVSVSSGTQGSQGSIRQGGKFGDDGYYRIYGTGFNQDHSERASGVPVRDGWQNRQVGFRADWGNASEGVTVQGDAYNANVAAAFGRPTMSGHNLLARWNRQLDNDASLQVQAYYDHTQRDDPSLYRDQEDTFDIEFQHALPVTGAHRVLWGGGSRYARSVTETRTNVPVQLVNGSLVQFLYRYDPPSRSLYWNNLFVQDEITLSPTLTMTLGIKAESNVYTGVEVLPSARLAWKLSETQLLWTALSRAVRAPSRIDRDFRTSAYLPAANFTLPLIGGGPNFGSEVAEVFELGYRAQPTSQLSYSITAFSSMYDKLRSGQVPVLAQGGAYVQNMLEGRTYGIETWGTYQVSSDWRLSAGFKTLREHFKLEPGSTDPDGAKNLGNDADNTWMLRSIFNLTSQHDFDVMVRRVGRLSFPVVPAYTAVDARLAWRPSTELELSLTAQNLFDSAHPEFGDVATRSEIGRNISLKARWTY